MATFYYTESHEYIKEDGGSYFLGISEHAQQELGDITFVEFPDDPGDYSKGDTLLTIESVKAVGEVYAPVDLKVTEMNSRLDDEPELVNGDAQGDGWLVKVELADPSQLESMMDQTAYDEMEK